MYHNALFKRNADKAAAFVKPLQVRIGYAYALIFTHELTDGSCIGCDELNVAELIGAEQMVKHFKKIVILIDRERHGAELIKAYAFFARHRVVLIKISISDEEYRATKQRSELRLISEKVYSGMFTILS